MTVSWPDLYLRHFTRYFGKPFDVEVFRHEEMSLRLATFDRPYPRYRIYASLGLSAQARDLKGVGEAIVLADDKGKDVPLLFVNALFFILARKIPLDSRFAVGGIEMVNPDFADYFNKSALYFTLADGFPAGLEKVEYFEEIGLVHQGIFISWEEQDFLNRNGATAFEERFRAQKGDPCTLRRPSCLS